ncbi:hypothetical protein RCL1_001582 [Eukaryota sp. TZLM3-RCL]
MSLASFMSAAIENQNLHNVIGNPSKLKLTSSSQSQSQTSSQEVCSPDVQSFENENLRKMCSDFQAENQTLKSANIQLLNQVSNLVEENDTLRGWINELQLMLNVVRASDPM